MLRKEGGDGGRGMFVGRYAVMVIGWELYSGERVRNLQIMDVYLRLTSLGPLLQHLAMRQYTLVERNLAIIQKPSCSNPPLRTPKRN